MVRFHTIPNTCSLAHSAPHYRQLGRLVAQVHECRPKDLALRYGELFMQALAVRATVRKHVNVLQHILGHFRIALLRRKKRNYWV